MINDDLLNRVNAECAKRTATMREYLEDVSHKIVHDQTEWLDSIMKRLMPPKLYDDAKHMRNLDAVKKYLHENDVRVIHIPDTLRIRVTIRDKIIAEWTPKFTVDGEPITMTPSIPPHSSSLTDN